MRPLSDLDEDEVKALKNMRAKGINRRQVDNGRWECLGVRMTRTGGATIPVVCQELLMKEADSSGNFRRLFCPHCDVKENPNPKVSKVGPVSQEEFNRIEREYKEKRTIQEALGEVDPEELEDQPPATVTIKEEPVMAAQEQPTEPHIIVTYRLNDLMADLAKEGELTIFTSIIEALDNYPMKTVKDGKVIIALQEGIQKIQEQLLMSKQTN